MNNKQLKLPKTGKKNEFNRELWLKKTLAQIPTGKKILDAGAGTQQYRKYCKHLDYTSQDFAEYDGQGDEKGLQMGDFDYGNLDIVSDITDIPKPNASFDVVMCIEVLEHLPEPTLALKELSRLLKTNGYIIITAPFCSLTHFAPYHFSTGFNRYWYQHHLEKNELEIVNLITNGDFFEYLAQEVKRIPSAAQRFTQTKPRLYEKIALRIIRTMLKRFSAKDSQSSELLCYGYHVLAQKKPKTSS